VYEWCNDVFAAYVGSAQTDPSGPSTGPTRVFRGGSWGTDTTTLCSAYRNSTFPINFFSSAGFRVAVRTP
jgi:sulfatase modifying factor 1